MNERCVFLKLKYQLGHLEPVYSKQEVADKNDILETPSRNSLWNIINESTA